MGDCPDVVRARARRLIEDLRRAPPELVHETAQRLTCVRGSLDLYGAGVLSAAELTRAVDRAESWLLGVYRGRWGLTAGEARGRGTVGECCW